MLINIFFEISKRLFICNKYLGQYLVFQCYRIIGTRYRSIEISITFASWEMQLILKFSECMGYAWGHGDRGKNPENVTILFVRHVLAVLFIFLNTGKSNILEHAHSTYITP